MNANAGPNPWREFVFHALASLAVLVLLFPGVFLHGEAISPGGLLRNYAPWNAQPGNPHATDGLYLPYIEYLCQWQTWYASAQRAWGFGEWPLWNPLQSTGVPLLANYQSAFFYPLRLPFAFLSLPAATTVYVLFKVWLTGLTAYLFARGIRLSVASAYFVSFAWMVAPMNIVWIFWCSSDVATWLPLQLLGIEFVLQRRNRAGFALIAFSGLLMLVAGHPESALTMAIGSGIYFLIRVALDWRHKPGVALRLSGVAAGAWLLAVCIAMVQLLPFLDYLVNSWTFAQREHEVTTTAASLEALVCLLVPRFFGISRSGTTDFWAPDINNSNFTIALYPGAAVVIVLTLLLTRPAWLAAHRRRMTAIAIPSILFLVAAFDHPVTRWLHVLPVLGAAWRFWYLPFVGFALVAVAGMIVDGWFSNRRQWPQLVPAPAISLFALAGIAAFLHVFHGADLPDSNAHAATHELLIASATTLLVILALAGPCTRLPSWTYKSFFSILLLADLLLSVRGILPTARPDTLYPRTQLTDWLLARQDQGRTFFFARDENNKLMPPGIISSYGIEEMFGYDGMLPYRIGRWYAEGLITGPTWRLQSARFRLEPAPAGSPAPPQTVADARLVDTIDGVHVYEDPMVAPRVRLLSAARIVEDPMTFFDTMRSGSVPFDKVALLESALPVPLPAASETDPGTAVITDRTMNTVTIDADVAQRSILVLTDQYFPGWQVEVDSIPHQLFPVYSLFRGVLLEPGKHHVVFRYAPRSFRDGMVLSVAGILLAAVISIGMLRRHAAGARHPANQTIL